MMASPAPTVSIVIPVYNRAGGLLEEALDSLLFQDHPDLEIIALDDGSTDETAEVLAAYADRHPESLRWASHENRGQAYTLGRGFEMANGDLLGYLSSDDVLLPGAVSRLAAALTADPEAVLAYPAYRVIDASGEKLDSVTPPVYSRAESVRLQDTVVGPGALFRAAAYARAGEMRSDLRYLADMDLWLRLGREGRFVRVDEELACWRRHGASLSGGEGGREMAEERLRLLDELFASPGADELEPVREEAYRNALILAATVITAGFNGPEGRYFVVDRHARTISSAAGPEDSETRLAGARRQIGGQRARIEALEATVEDLRRRPLRGGVAARARTLAGNLRRRRSGRG